MKGAREAANEPPLLPIPTLTLPTLLFSLEGKPISKVKRKIKQGKIKKTKQNISKK
jgi:hypothetical protein